MRIVIIGATGHVGTFLVPRLVEAGHEVVSVSRGLMQPYRLHHAWNCVRKVLVNREDAEADGTFGPLILELKPDAVIDMICFTEKSARQLANILRGNVQHLLVCGSIWVHGPSISVPAKENDSRNPFGEYGIQKARIESYLLSEARMNNFPATVLHPGHIVGPNWIPINPLGNFNPQVFSTLATGKELAMPTYGMETLHHVHADDVAQAFFKALSHWNNAVGEHFHVVSEAAVTMSGYAKKVASWFGKEAKLKVMAGDIWKANLTEKNIGRSMDHILHSPNCSIDKAIDLLEYKPRYTSFQAIYDAIQWMIEQELIVTG